MKYRKMCDVTGNMNSRCNGILNDITVSGVVTVASDLSDSQRENSESGVSSTESSDGSSMKRSKGGRPSGTTYLQKKKNEELLIEVKNIITKKYAEMKRTAERKNIKMKYRKLKIPSMK